MEIIWHTKAEKDLNKNISYISKRSPQNALIVLNAILNLSESLRDMPYKYPKEPIYNHENVRFVTKWSYKIIYRITADKIYILRLFNTNQHPDRIKE